MNAAEGFRRVARIVSIIGWLMALLSVVYFYLGLREHAGGSSVFNALIGGLLVCALAQGIAWIIRGFAVPRTPKKPGPI
jgi:hypothetical protein